MARPKYSEGDNTAKQNLIEAFWKCLETDPFEKITVKQVSGLAGVNKNTFYYHFDTMEELARAAAMEIPLNNFPLNLLFSEGDAYLSEIGRLATEQDISGAIGHIGLLAGRNGQAVSHIIDETFFKIFEEYGGIDPDQLTLKEQFTLNMLIGAIKNNLRNVNDVEKIRETMVAAVASPIVKVAYEEVRKISERHKALREKQGKA